MENDLKKGNTNVSSYHSFPAQVRLEFRTWLLANLDPRHHSQYTKLLLHQMTAHQAEEYK